MTELLALKEPEEIEQYLIIKYVYPMGKLITLEAEKTFQEQNIPHGAQLILLGQKNFTWDSNFKGNTI